jgi:hypothetical protein
MSDLYEEISNSLTDLVELFEELSSDREKKDFVIKEIEIELHHLLSLAKSVGGKVLEETHHVVQISLPFVVKGELSDKELSSCVESCLSLKNQLWEL